jgi:hypothetical protein
MYFELLSSCVGVSAKPRQVTIPPAGGKGTSGKHSRQSGEDLDSQGIIFIFALLT